MPHPVLEAGVFHLSTYGCFPLYQKNNPCLIKPKRIQILPIASKKLVYSFSSLLLLITTFPSVSLNSPFPAAKGKTLPTSFPPGLCCQEGVKGRDCLGEGLGHPTPTPRGQGCSYHGCRGSCQPCRPAHASPEALSVWISFLRFCVPSPKWASQGKESVCPGLYPPSLH